MEIHFFTIVLNGMPFIKHHIDILKQLPFKWHWHVVEGVAELKHDTGWSVGRGGRITDELHRNGLSNDGTTEYLNVLYERFAGQVTLYRKDKGAFWDGKREMVNEPLNNITEPCLLWQVDADELWTAKQIEKMYEMFWVNPTKTSAWFWCRYYVGENLVITIRNCYAQNPQQEWHRVWRYEPGNRWTAHEPPMLCANDDNPFTHDETERAGLVFQHYAYVTPAQVRFKEIYYGYAQALNHWTRLQQNKTFPVKLREYLPWVTDNTEVNVEPLTSRQERGL